MYWWLVRIKSYSIKQLAYLVSAVHEEPQAPYKLIPIFQATIRTSGHLSVHCFNVIRGGAWYGKLCE